MIDHADMPAEAWFHVEDHSSLLHRLGRSGAWRYQSPFTNHWGLGYFFSAGFNFTIMYFVFAQFGTGSV